MHAKKEWVIYFPFKYILYTVYGAKTSYFDTKITKSTYNYLTPNRENLKNIFIYLC